MPTFTGKTFSNFYKNLLGINQTTNTGVDATTRTVQDGAGNTTAISLSDDVFSVKPVTDNTTGTMLVKNQGGSNILAVDTTNSKVLAGASQVVVNTHYVYFGVNDSDSTGWEQNIHFPVPFIHGSFSAAAMDTEFGTGDDPDDSHTTASVDMQFAAQIVPFMWRIPGNITIDEIKHIEGADSATGDTTRMHLKSYDFTSGSTSCLTNGALLAHTTADNVNDGNEQAYLKDWTLDTADVDSGKVVLCFFRKDGNNSDYALNVTIKYHIR